MSGAAISVVSVVGKLGEERIAKEPTLLLRQVESIGEGG